MVIEVKKQVFMKELSEGYDNLQSVVKTQSGDYRNLSGKATKDAFRLIAKRPLNDFNDLSNLSYQEQMLYHTLVVEELLPIRVIWGYSGFCKEEGLRSKLIEYLTKHLSTNTSPQLGYGPHSLPNLIVAGDNAIIKTNGMPYSMHVEGIDGFCWLASYRRNPVLLLLELLWTRLNYQFDLPTMFFGDEINNESLAPLLAIQAGDYNQGWNYTNISYIDEYLSEIDKTECEWQPTVLNEDEFIIINLLCEGKIITIKDLVSYFENQERAKIAIKKLTWSHLIYVENDVIKLLTKECKCVIMPQYGWVAADDYDCRLMNWVRRKMKEIKNKGED